MDWPESAALNAIPQLRCFSWKLLPIVSHSGFEKKNDLRRWMVREMQKEIV